MIKLEAGNVLLKPSHRKQMMAWFRRAQRLGSRLGQFILTITMQVLKVHSMRTRKRRQVPYPKAMSSPLQGRP